MMYGLAVRLAVTGDIDADGLLDQVDEITQHLTELEDCTPGLLDNSIGIDTSTGMFEAEITIEADKAEDAFSAGMSCLRSAIHAAGGSTPDWDEVQPDGTDVVLYRLNQDEAIELRPLLAAV